MAEFNAPVKNAISSKALLASMPGFEESCARRGISPFDAFENPALLRQPERNANGEPLQFTDLPDEAWVAVDQAVIRQTKAVLSAVGRIPAHPTAGATVLGTEELRVLKVGDPSLVNEGMNPDASPTPEENVYDTEQVPVPFTWLDGSWPVGREQAWGTYQQDFVTGATALLAQTLETMLFSGSKTYNGSQAIGLDGIPAGNKANAAGANANARKWNNAGKTGENRIEDVVNALTAIGSTDSFAGPVDLILDAGSVAQLATDYTSNYPVTNRARVEQALSGAIVESTGITSANAGRAYFVSLDGTTVRWASMLAPSVLTWTSPTGFTRYVKVVAKAVPVIVDRMDDAIGVRSYA